MIFLKEIIKYGFYEKSVYMKKVCLINKTANIWNLYGDLEFA